MKTYLFHLWLLVLLMIGTTLLLPGCATIPPPKAHHVVTLPSGAWIVFLDQTQIGLTSGSVTRRARARLDYLAAQHAKRIGCKKFITHRTYSSRLKRSYKCIDVESNSSSGLYTDDILALNR